MTRWVVPISVRFVVDARDNRERKMVSLHRVVKYPKTLAVIIAVLVLLSVGIYLLVRNGSGSSKPNEAPVHVIVITRHGEREPLMRIPRKDDFVLGELTEYGRESMQFLGSQLKEEYAPFLKRASKTRVTSTSDARCRDSALALATGMEVKDFVENLLPKFVLEDPDDLIASPRSSAVVELIGTFRQTFPPCVQRIATAVFNYLKEKGDLSEDLQFLIGFLIADSIDTIRMQGGDLPFNLTYAMDCLPKTVPLIDEKVFAGFSHVCMKSFCRPVVKNLLDELESVHSGDAPTTLSIYGVSDVHVQNLMVAIKPEDPPVRPLFGGHLVFEVTSSSVTVNYGIEPRAKRQHFKTVRLNEIVAILHSLLDSQADV